MIWGEQHFVYKINDLIIKWLVTDGHKGIHYNNGILFFCGIWSSLLFSLFSLLVSEP